MKTLTIIVALSILSFWATAQRFEWLTHTSQTAADGSQGEVSPIALDPQGNIYTVVSATAAALTIQGNTVPSNNSSVGLAVIKLDPNGNFLWGKMFNGDPSWGVDSGDRIAVDDSGFVYVGMVSYPGPNIITDDTTFNASSPVIVKLDPNGNYVQSQIFPVSGPPRFDILGNDLYVTTKIAGDHAVQKMDSAFNVKWSISAPTISLEYNGSIRPDLFVQANGQLVLSALEGSNFAGPVTFGDGTIPFTFGSTDEVAIVKMDTTGHVHWARTLLTPVSQYPNIKAVGLDHNGNAYMGINGASPDLAFAGTTIQNPMSGQPWAALLKWDSAGNEVWARGLYFDPVNSGPNNVRISNMAINEQNQVIITGYGSDISINGDTLINASGTNRFFVMKFDAEGNFIWYKSESGLIGNYSSRGDGIAIRNGNEYIVGGTSTVIGNHSFGCWEYNQTTTDKSFVTFIREVPEGADGSFTYQVAANTVSFVASDTNAASWNWDFGDGSTSNEQNPVHTFAGGGEYTVSLTAEFGTLCSDTESETIVFVGHEPLSLGDVSVFPNPAQNEVRLTGVFAPGSTVEIQNVLGEQVIPAVGISNGSVNVSGLSAGTYFVVISNSGNTRRGKFVKQ